MVNKSLSKSKSKSYVVSKHKGRTSAPSDHVNKSNRYGFLFEYVDIDRDKYTYTGMWEI